jgi:hypothetical protein
MVHRLRQLGAIAAVAQRGALVRGLRVAGDQLPGPGGRGPLHEAHVVGVELGRERAQAGIELLPGRRARSRAVMSSKRRSRSARSEVLARPSRLPWNQLRRVADASRATPDFGFLSDGRRHHRTARG